MISRTNYCAECEQHAREITRLRRIIKAWEEGRLRRQPTEHEDSGGVYTGFIYAVGNGYFATPAEACAALEKDGE